MFNPNRSRNILSIDASGHVCFIKDPATNLLNPNGSDSIGTFDPENENVMGKIFRHFLERNNLVATDTFFDTGKTFYTHTGSMTRIDYLCTTSSVCGGGRCSKTSVLNRLGDICQKLHRAIDAIISPLAHACSLSLRTGTSKPLSTLVATTSPAPSNVGGIQASTLRRSAADWAGQQ